MGIIEIIVPHFLTCMLAVTRYTMPVLVDELLILILGVFLQWVHILVELMMNG
jgi:hypothetical protein